MGPEAWSFIIVTYSFPCACSFKYTQVPFVLFTQAICTLSRDRSIYWFGLVHVRRKSPHRQIHGKFGKKKRKKVLAWGPLFFKQLPSVALHHKPYCLFSLWIVLFVWPLAWNKESNIVQRLTDWNAHTAAEMETEAAQPGSFYSSLQARVLEFLM